MSLEAGVLTVQLNQDISVACESGGKGICGSTVLIHVMNRSKCPNREVCYRFKFLVRTLFGIKTAMENQWARKSVGRSTLKLK